MSSNQTRATNASGVEAMLSALATASSNRRCGASRDADQSNPSSIEIEASNAKRESGGSICQRSSRLVSTWCLTSHGRASAQPPSDSSCDNTASGTPVANKAATVHRDKVPGYEASAVAVSRRLTGRLPRRLLSCGSCAISVPTAAQRCASCA